MGGLFDHDLIPLLFVLVMLANVFLDRRNRCRRQQELPQEQPQETAEPTQAEQQTQAKPKDLEKDDGGGTGTQASKQPGRSA